MTGEPGAKGVGVGSSEIGSGATTMIVVDVASNIGVSVNVGGGVGVDVGNTGMTELGSMPGGTMITPG
jgi:hypothetical protein